LNVLEAGDIRFDDVSFSYEQEQTVLRNVSFVIPAGSKVGVQGPSGVGKTTLVDLLHRHYDSDQGAISIAGQNLTHVDIQELRRRIAVVAQDTVLLSGSILDNVKYANPDAPDDQVGAALERAQVTEFSRSFPEGVHTQVGTRGAALSGGQRQRIAIARALLQGPHILILDEATTGVDRAAERKIVAAIDELFHGRTRLIITHRPIEDDSYDMTLTITIEGEVTVSRR
ncbi:MAG: ATP-binding cassette domain-containing protein, partial [Gammaproteobacteria bacterium]|nr:ATP-binding cassette domain-containing protein [Gammaproteobacteria bacterium]